MVKMLAYTENLISGMLPFVFLIFSGIYLTIKSGFFQIIFLPKSVKGALGGIFSREKADNGITPFQAACTALSATVGTGNIAGVAGAVSLGGAGAVFWMWISAFAGMIVKSAEIILALYFREKKDDNYFGGPMYYIKKGMPKIFSPLGGIFAFFGIFSVFCSGNITQTNSAIASVGNSLTIKIIFGIAFALVTALVIIGGAKRIGVFTERIVPIMALLYVILSFGIILVNIEALPNVFKMIFKGAFKSSAVTGGMVGSAMTAVITGASRGVFSNEAGLGTSAMAHSTSAKNGGVEQSLFGIFEVFADTVILCTLTALTILCSGVNIEYGKTASTELVAESLFGLYGNSSHIMLAIMMCLFGISSVVGWGVYGITCSGFVFGKIGERIFVLIYPLFCIIGAISTADTAWRLSSFFNGIMLCINTFAVLWLSDIVLKGMKEYRKRGKISDKEQNRKSTAKIRK